ncbi:Fe-S-containing hydro-lyase [Shouchella shacheensis]|uniref:Fe-S-containing hydro-lyase n=1 Tax=Shouchella shacheensis TaxID=1649580 RepID=UPI000AAED15C|nr:Fe-S-containing hydro-lyase [Shouchella shacheensis]
MAVKKIILPLTEENIQDLEAGDRVLLTGDVYAARDAAHKRLMELIEKKEELLIELQGEVIYYVGPTPAKPGQVVGSAGPTTSGRMDKYTPTLLSLGLKGMIGKGYRNEPVKKAIQEYNAVYFAAVGGSGALLSKTIQADEVVAYEDLGPEAIRRLTIKDFPVTVINDCQGNDWYEQGTEAYRQGGK